MKKSHDYLFIAAFTMMAFLIAAAALKMYSGYAEKKVAEEMEEQRMAAVIARNAEAQSRVFEMESEIVQMTGDVENLQTFIDETVAAANEVQIRKEAEAAAVATVTDSAMPDYERRDVSGNTYGCDLAGVSGNGADFGAMSVSGNYAVSGNAAVSGNDVDLDALPVFSASVVSGNVMGYEGMMVSGNASILGSTSVSGNTGYEGLSASGNTIGYEGMAVSGNAIGYEGMDVSGNTLGYEGMTVSGNISISGNTIGFGSMTVSVNASGNNIFAGWQYVPPEISLEERKALRSSYEETMEVNQVDREYIAGNQHDFSQMKIACLGDSITAASNLENEENYGQYSYPSILGELLGAGEIVNLGIGGSSIGRYWADPFVERYTQIPQDTDIIIVMGGTNDGFCVSADEFGNLNDRVPKTFCGDLNELMRGLREHYPSAVIFFVTPLPNVLHDYLMSEKEYLLPQRYFADVIRTIASEYGIETIDLYNSNILDSHDANVIAEYMPDGVHGNHAGYQVLAERFVSEIIQYYD